MKLNETNLYKIKLPVIEYYEIYVRIPKMLDDQICVYQLIENALKTDKLSIHVQDFNHVDSWTHVENSEISLIKNSDADYYKEITTLTIKPVGSTEEFESGFNKDVVIGNVTFE